MNVTRTPSAAGAAFSGAYTYAITILTDARGSAACAAELAEGASACSSPGNVPPLAVALPPPPAPGAPLLADIATSVAVAAVTETAAGNVVSGSLRLTFTGSAGGAPFTTPAFPAAATASEVAAALRAPGSPVTALRVARSLTDGYRTHAWSITFLGVTRAATPCGAGNHALLAVDAGALTVSAPGGLSPSSPSVAVTTPGSPGLSGAFALNLNGAPSEAVEVPYSTSARDLATTLQAIPGLGQVAVTLDSVYGAGWGCEYIDPVARAANPSVYGQGGVLYTVRWLGTPGSYTGGVSLPAGSGVPPALVAAALPSLEGVLTAVKALSVTGGGSALGGGCAFVLGGAAGPPSPPLPFTASPADCATALSFSNPSVGAVACAVSTVNASPAWALRRWRPAARARAPRPPLTTPPPVTSRRALRPGRRCAWASPQRPHCWGTSTWCRAATCWPLRPPRPPLRRTCSAAPWCRARRCAWAR